MGTKMHRFGGRTAGLRLGEEKVIADLLHSCSNGHVATAALTSIGGGLPERMRRVAERHGVSAGCYAVRAVLHFESKASAEDFEELAAWLHGHDLPLLAGLQFILERAEAEALRGEPSTPFIPGKENDPHCLRGF